MQGWRRAVRTLLLWTSLVVFLLLGLSGVLLGSMGVDVHWTSKESSLCHHDVRRSARLRLRSGRSQIAERDKDLRQVTGKTCGQVSLRSPIRKTL